MSKSIIRLCDWNQPGDIPEVEVERAFELVEILSHWLKGKSFDKVFACFDTWRIYEQHPYILVVKGPTRVMEYGYRCAKIINPNAMCDFNVFEFENWKEAFEYCLELKEGL